MVLKKAKISEIDNIVSFYCYVTDKTANMARYGRWVFGKHPTREMIVAYIENENMFYAQEDGSIIAALAVTLCQNEEYHSIDWAVKAQDTEIAVVHILCVSPDKQGEGIAKAIIKEVCRYAYKQKKKAVRLDALCCNTPAHALYRALDFELRGVKNCYASNTGWIDFYYFEKRLSENDLMGISAP